MSFATKHMQEVSEIAGKIDTTTIENMVDLLAAMKIAGGRLFILGVGGSAGNASHAVNDFRKLAGIETYAPTDNVSELTARTNDDGWESVFEGYLKISKLGAKDCLLILSVGGGDFARSISLNLCKAIDYAKVCGAKVMGIVGRSGGYTEKMADISLVVPPVNPNSITPHSEAFQSIVWHLMVSHPKLKDNTTTW